MRIGKAIAALWLLGVPIAASAAEVVVLPEPETIGLIAGAAVAWAIVHWRKRK